MGTIYWSIVMYINSRQMCALTFTGQRKCGAFGTCTERRVVSCCCSEYRRTVAWLVKYVQHGEVDNLTNGGKTLSWSNVIIAVQKLQYVQEKG